MTMANEYSYFCSEDQVSNLCFETLSDDEMVKQLYYYSEENKFYDSDGAVVMNTYDYVRPIDIWLFLKDKESVCLPGKQQPWVELIYPETDEIYSIIQ